MSRNMGNILNSLTSRIGIPRIVEMLKHLK